MYYACLLLLGLSLTAAKEHPPQATLQLGIALKDVEIREGYDINFECNISANPWVTEVSFYFEDQKIRTNVSAGVIVSNQTLMLQNVQRSNRGNYYCMVTNAEGQGKSNEVFLRIRYSPHIEIPPENQTVISRGTAFLVCTASGDPKPQIEWQKNGKSLYLTGRRSTHDILDGSLLRIQPVQDNRDNATYTCKAENGVGMPASASAVLTVLSEDARPDGFPKIDPQISAKVIETGKNALLPCQVSGDPRPTVTWLKNELPLNMTVSRYSIVEDSLQITGAGDDDQGSYECVAENSVGLAVSDALKLYVIEERRVPPQFAKRPAAMYVVLPGSDLNITCVAVGFPMPFVKWLTGSLEMTQEVVGKSILVLENVTSSANYTCIASSTLGTIESMTLILLKDPPQVTLQLGIALKDVEITEGYDINFECNISANPWVTEVSFYFEDQKIRTNVSAGVIVSNQTLILQNVQRSNRGNYYCMVTNAEGQGKSNEVFLRIRYSPHIEIPPENQTVISRGTAFLVCTASGDPKPQIEWQKNGKRLYLTGRRSTHDILDGSLLRIQPVLDNRDNATYTCKAENGVGMPASASAVLTVLSEDARPDGFPKIDPQISAKVVEKGKNALLPCQVSGDPRPTVTWLKNELPLNMTVSRYSIVEDSLQITGAGDDDQGSYECVAENSVGLAVSDALNLYVIKGFLLPELTGWFRAPAPADVKSLPIVYNVIPSAVVFHIAKPEAIGFRERRVPPQFARRPAAMYVVLPGSDLNITCVAAGFPMPFVKWLTGSLEMTQEVIGKSILVLENVTSSANYTCIASSTLGTIESMTLILLKDPPQATLQLGIALKDVEIREGYDINFECNISANPWDTEVSFYFEDQKIRTNVSAGVIVSNQTLILQNVHRSNRGNYYCMVTNAEGQGKSNEVFLRIRYSPHIEIPPENQTVISRGTAFLVCTASGDPKPQIEWQKNGKRLYLTGRRSTHDILDGSLLRIQPVLDNRDNATYTCKAENGVGMPASASAVLTVLSEDARPDGFPKIDPQISAKVIETGKNALLPCQVSGDPRPTVTWLKNELPLNMTVSRYSIVEDSLQITGAGDDDQGSYECVAENSVGLAVSDALKLYVIKERRVPPQFARRPAAMYVVLPGSDLNITCVAAGFPMPFVKWLTGSLEMTQEVIGKSILVLENVTSNANYTCIATSTLGTIEAKTLILLKDTNLETLSTVNGTDLPPLPQDQCNQCELRYMKHYEVKNCFPVFAEEQCHCPTRFDCSNVQSTPEKFCVYDQKTYKIGERIPTPELCQRCSCRLSFLGGAEMLCVPVECSSQFGLPPGEGCYEIYEPDKCCSVDVKCTDPVRQSQGNSSVMPELGEKPELFSVIGGNVSLPCNVSVTEDVISMITWYKKGMSWIPVYTVTSNDSSLESARQFVDINLDSRAAFHVVEDTPTLIIDPVKAEDDGIYMCQAEILHSRIQAQSMKLHVEEPTCELDGKIFHFGERIYPKTDPCLSCICTERWAKGIANNCHIRDCLLERKLRYLRKGCIPIYHADKCCPIEFYCGTGESAVPKNNSVPHSPDACVFEGKPYSIGEVLEVMDQTKCITCTCKIPPDFTCVRKTCPGPPQGDYKNCRAVYHEKECCPTYDCPQPLTSAACEPLQCSNGCQEFTGPDGCSVCLCGKLLCTTPKCLPGCEVEYDVPFGSCPRCRCKSSAVQFAPLKCSPVQCEPHCFEGTGPDGCLMCICGPLCSPPNCDANCSLQREVPQGQCRGCVCQSQPDRDLVNGILYDQEIQCVPVICPPLCHETVAKFGCPTCVCDVCPLPKCKPGCEVESVPLPGRCPECVCNVN